MARVEDVEVNNSDKVTNGVIGKAQRVSGGIIITWVKQQQELADKPPTINADNNMSLEKYLSQLPILVNQLAIQVSGVINEESYSNQGLDSMVEDSKGLVAGV